MVGPRRVWFGWLPVRGAAGATAAALQHTTRGSVKQRRAPGGLLWRAGAGAGDMVRLVRRCFALPLLYAERARSSAGGMMGGAAPRAAVRASSRRDSRAVGERARVGVRARLPARSVTREGAVGRRRAVRNHTPRAAADSNTGDTHSHSGCRKERELGAKFAQTRKNKIYRPVHVKRNDNKEDGIQSHQASGFRRYKVNGLGINPAGVREQIAN